MRSLLLAGLLLVPAASFASGVVPGRSLHDRIINWDEQKAEALAMNERLLSTYKTTETADVNDQIKEIDAKIWALFNKVENDMRANRDAMRKAIDERAAAGKFTQTTAANLKARLGMIFAARCYYLYGNMYSRIMEEGYSELRPTPRQILGSRLDLQITDDQLKAFTADWDFDPAAYGLPKMPDINAKG